MLKINRPILGLLCLLFIPVSLCAQASPAPTPASKLTPAQWREDLRYFATNMAKTHKNLFHTLTREQFDAAVKKLDERVSSMADHEIIVELMRIVARVGDGHTGVRLPEQFNSAYPLRLYIYKDGLFVQAAAPEYREAVGARVLKIGNAETAQALHAVSEIAWRDNEMGVKAIVPTLLVIPEVLHALRLTDGLQQAEFVFEKDGRQKKLELKPSGQLRPLLRGTPPDWLDARAAKSLTPLWLKDPQNNFWFEHLSELGAAGRETSPTVREGVSTGSVTPVSNSASGPGVIPPGTQRGGMLYVQFNAVQDKAAVGDKPGETVAAFFKRVFEYIETNQVDKLVLDLRLNGGGNNYLNLPITLGTIRSRVNKRGNLFVILGRATFSAAQNTVNELEKYTNAIFVGEPTAATPNHFGDSRNVVLPNSKIAIRASTLWWQDMDPRDRRKWTAPEIAAELISSDYSANHDPAMAAILKFVPGESLPEITAAALAEPDITGFIRRYRAYKADPAHIYIETEAAINQLGYNLMAVKRLDHAIEVFKLNVEDFPRSANVYDSLAEAYLNKGNKELAIKFYTKALEVDSTFPSAIEALRQLKAN